MDDGFLSPSVMVGLEWSLHFSIEIQDVKLPQTMIWFAVTFQTHFF